MANSINSYTYDAAGNHTHTAYDSDADGKANTIEVITYIPAGWAALFVVGSGDG